MPFALHEADGWLSWALEPSWRWRAVMGHYRTDQPVIGASLHRHCQRRCAPATANSGDHTCQFCGRQDLVGAVKIHERSFQHTRNVSSFFHVSQSTGSGPVKKSSGRSTAGNWFNHVLQVRSSRRQATPATMLTSPSRSTGYGVSLRNKKAFVGKVVYLLPGSEIRNEDSIACLPFYKIAFLVPLPPFLSHCMLI
jgi:hypothetical protein